MDKTSFTTTYYPAAKIAGEKYGINPIVILAQAAHESGWGDSYAVRNRRNFFGIIAAGSPNAYWNGASDTSSASGLTFRVYSSPENSFLDFSRLISSKYPSAAKVSSDTAAYAHAIANSPYISEENGDNRAVYEQAVKSNADFMKAILAPQILRDQEAAKKKG